MEDRRKLERELADARRKLAMGGGAAAGPSDQGVKTVGSVKYLGRAVTGIEPKDLKGLADVGKRSIGSGVVAIVGVTAYRVAFGCPKAQIGEQPDRLAGARVWVLPNPSGLNAHHRPADFGRAFAALYRESRREGGDGPSG